VAAQYEFADRSVDLRSPTFTEKNKLKFANLAS